MLIVFVRDLSFIADDITNETDIVDCISDVIWGVRPTQRLVFFDSFRASAFPHLSTASAPRRPEYLGMLLKDPNFQERIRPLGIRFVVFVGGTTTVAGSEGGISCGAGLGFGWCLGLVTWQHSSQLGASILDLTRMEPPRALATSASDTAWFAMFMILPMGFPSMTEGKVCRDLGGKIARFLETDAEETP